MVKNGEWVDLRGQLAGQVLSPPPLLSWRQIKGTAVNLRVNPADSAQVGFVAPDSRETTDLYFEFSAQLGGQQFTDSLNVRVEPCNNSENVIFGDCITPGFGPWRAYESTAGVGEIFHSQGIGNFHVSWQSVDTGDAKHGRVMEIRWNANDPNHTQNANGWFGLALPGASDTAGMDLQAYSQGAISFDMRLVYHEQPAAAAPFIFKTECVLPCASTEFPIPKGNSSFDWQTHTYAIKDLVASGLDLSKINHLLIIQPAWRNQEHNVTVQLDNVRLVKNYTPPPPDEGCVGSGKVSYTLTRAANPTADQQQAYNLIASAMDTAVKNYNCYTNLTRHLQVTYNPSVATADGNPNGSIRFGSRGSMHHVTAMHEIGHVFGVGDSRFRTLVKNGIFTGARATAKVKAISGNLSEQLKSDGTHMWPHGLNYISEGKTQQDLINHCLVVQEVVADLASL